MTGPANDFAALMLDVAHALLGEPNARLSNARELRYGTHGSLAVHVGGPHAGTWRDHEADAGGGVLALVVREAGARDPREAMAWLREGGFLDGEPGRQARRGAQPPRKPPDSRSEPFPGPDDADARRKVARRVWESTEPLPGTIAERYLHARGVGHVSGAPALRFHPALTHPFVPGRFPALVAGVQDVHGGFLGVQRTYLDSTGAGKANVEPARASLRKPERRGGSPGGAGARAAVACGRGHRIDRGGDGAVRRAWLGGARHVRASER